VRTRLINSYRPTDSIEFVSGDLVLLAVAELFVPILHDTNGERLGADAFGNDEAAAVDRNVIHSMPRYGTAHVLGGAEKEGL